MPENLLEISTYSGKGYKPLVDFNCWRVAFLRFADDMQPSHITTIEKHLETDEVFVLMEGQALLFTGGGEESVTEMYSEIMLPCRLYNVKAGAWHAVVMSPEGTILLVENKDTNKSNSAYCDLTAEQKEFLRLEVQKKLPEWWM